MRTLSFLMIGFVLLSVSGCTPQRHLERILNRHPELQKPVEQVIKFEEKILTDTLYIHRTDTVLLAGRIDSIIQLLPDTNCRKLVRKKIQSTLVQAAADQRCLDTPLVHTGTIQYTNDTASLLIDYSIQVEQPTANAFNIQVRSTGGKVLLKYKTVEIREITSREIWRYRKEGAGLLLALLIFLLLCWLALRIYFSTTGGGAIANILSRIR